MSDPNKPNSDSGENEFGLVAPSGDLAKPGEGERPLTEAEKSKTVAPLPPKKEGVKFKQGGWKGFEEEEVDEDPELDFISSGSSDNEEMDMTPMVDVVFLLLIFFMVTASFTVQQSIEQPHSKVDDPSNVVIEEPEEEDEYVEVIIDQTNTFFITTREEEEVEAPSVNEMKARMRDAKLGTGANRLIITAHIDARHRNVVTVWDAGNSIGMERIEMRTTDEDY